MLEHDLSGLYLIEDDEGFILLNETKSIEFMLSPSESEALVSLLQRAGVVSAELPALTPEEAVALAECNEYRKSVGQKPIKQRKKRVRALPRTIEEKAENIVEQIDFELLVILAKSVSHNTFRQIMKSSNVQELTKTCCDADRENAIALRVLLAGLKIKRGLWLTIYNEIVGFKLGAESARTAIYELCLETMESEREDIRQRKRIWVAADRAEKARQAELEAGCLPHQEVA